MKAQVLSGEYRLAKKELGSPGSLTLTPGTVKLAGERVSVLVAALDSLSAVGGLDLLEMPHTDLAASLERMASGRTAAANLPHIRELEARFRKAGAWNFIERIGNGIEPECAVLTVEHAWLGRILEDLEFEDQRLAAFDASTLSRHREEFHQGR